MILSDTSIRRPVLAIVINVVLILIGVIAYERLSVRLIPNVDTPVVTVATSYPGANAKVIESQITKPIEDVLSGIEGVDFISSVNRAEQSQITVTFLLDRDADAAASDVRDRVAQARQFLPEEADEPIVQKQEGDAQPIIYLAFSSDRHSRIEIGDLATRLVKDRVQTIPGVAQAQVFGSRYAMRVWLQPDRLAAYQLTPADVEAALRAQNIEIPAGRVESIDREYTVLAQTDLNTAEQFGAVIVRDVKGALVRLRDVARVELGEDQSRFSARFNGRTAVPLGIVKQAVANPLEISDALQTMLPQIERTLPEGMKVEIAYDTTVFIRSSIKEVYTTIAEAVVLVVLVIFFFLRSGRAVLIPLVTIPVSLIGTFALMAALGFSINTLTLLALVLAIGLVVDDAIVMLENIYRYIEQGMKPREAAFKGSGEIAFAIIAMTLTLAAVYAPMAFQTGRTGKLFTEFALTLAGAVLVSGFTALTLSPMMCARLLRHETRHGAMYQRIEGWLAALDRGYRSALRHVLGWRWAMLGGAAAMTVAMLWLFTTLPQELAPEEDQGLMIGIAVAPEGATMEYTDGYVQKMAEFYKDLPEVEKYFQITGFPVVTQGINFVRFKDWSERDRSSAQIVGSLFPQFMGLAGVMAFPITPPALGQQGFGQPVQFVVQTTGTWEELDDIVQRMLSRMRDNPLLTNPDSDLKLNKPELRVEVNREKISMVGSSVAEVGRTVETMMGGRNVTRFKQGSEQYDVIVQVEDKARQTPSDLSSIYVRGNNDEMVQLANLATVTETVAAKELNHFNKLRSATISAGLGPDYAMGDALEWMEAALAEVAPEALYDLSGQAREFRASSSSFATLLLLSVIFIYLVLAAQFESFIDPFIILFSVLPAFFGAFVALKLSHGSWNIYSQIGVITLIGLIAKHGILIVEFANQLRERGEAKLQAVAEAAALRLRPILMTTGAMVLGAIPLALASGAGAEARHQIGWVIVGGMSFGTAFTLFLVPVGYLLLSRSRTVYND
ncbi:MAG: multidrug transporter AcrB [Gammaproteobacteria bacterium HGW-Gammaproteobacteria-2]|jgi:multidrug efflux pump|nr:MAG: multidrug transporter AcrB [Gammaproteobacteria bacterium HGW-Gammaproteobacteria-2]